MNGVCKFKSLRLVRFGDILYDQQRRLIMLCRSCQRHYLTLDAFQAHLNKCISLKHITSSINELHYDENKRETRLLNGKQELHIYEPNAVTHNKCDIDWEAELEDPRWYTDEGRNFTAKAKQSTINAKENMAKTRTRQQTAKETQKRNIQQQPQQQLSTQSPAKRVRHSEPADHKRTILTNQQQYKSRSSVPTNSAKKKSDVLVVQSIVQDLKSLDTLTKPRATTKPTIAAKPMVSIPATNIANGDTQQILNKLRACGVEVKRSNTREAIDNAGELAANIKKQQALDIMRKLQSNGIKCTKVNKVKQ